MNKQEFLTQLRNGLSGLPQDELEERLAFYNEMIDDRMEEGLSEEEAVCQAGPVAEIVAQVVTDIPLAKITKERIQSKRQLKTWEIVLFALGCPVWLCLGVAAAAVIFSLYVSVWAVMISLWAVFGSLAACAFGGMAAGILFARNGSSPAGWIMLAVGIVCAGLSVFLFFGCKEATKGILLCMKKLALWTKNRFIRKEEAQ